MRPYLPVSLPIMFILLTVSVIALSPSASADNEESFEDGCFEYRIENDCAVIVDYIGEELEVVDVPDTVTHEGTEYDVVKLICTFWDEFIVEVNIGRNVYSISDYCFQAKNLKNIDVSADNEWYTTVDGVLFNKGMNTLISYPVGKAGDFYEVPASVSCIGSFAFEYSDNLHEVILNEGLVKIDRYAFGNCTSLQHISSPDSNDVFPSTVSMIGEFAFYRCGSLNSFTLPLQLEVIGQSAFEYCGMETVSLPHMLWSIGPGAFSNCTELKEFVFSEGYSSYYDIRDGVLYTTTYPMKLITYPAGKDTEVFYMYENAGPIEYSAFAGCKYLKEVVLSPKVTEIDSGAFENCHSLERMDLSNVFTVGVFAFDNCENLTDVKFGNNLYFINSEAFNASGITSLTLGENLMDIGMSAFSQCKNLKEVVITEHCKLSVRYGTFYGSVSLEKITVEGYDTVFETGALDIGYSEETITTVDVHVKAGYSLPDDVGGDFTVVNVIEEGKRPYPYENFIGVGFCIILLIGILFFVREV